MNKPFLRTASTILVFVLVSMVPAWRLVTEPHRSVTLRDGTRLTLLRTSWGKVHRFGGSPLSGLVRVLPPLPPAWTPEAPYEMTTPLPSIGLWVSAEGPSAEELGSVAWEIIDGTGAAIPVRPSTHHVRRPGEPATMGFAFTAFPRRDPSFKLRAAFDRRGPNAESSGEFDVPNPIPKRERRAFPVWTAEPVPAMRKVGELEIELIRLLTCSSWDGKEIRKAKPRDDNSWSGVAEFRVRERGAPAPDWFPDGVVLQDATGNVVNQTSWSHASKEDTAMLLWDPALWPDAGGWKARFEFTRDKEAKFSAAELFEVTSSSPLSSTFVRLGHTVTIGKLPTVADPELTLQATPPLLDKQLDAVRAIDDQGRPLESRGNGWSRPSGSYTFKYVVEPGAKELRITLALHASVYVDFHAVPVAP